MVYLENYQVKGINYWPIIMITYEKYIFYVNNKKSHR